MFERIWIDIKSGENLDTYATVVACLILLILNAFGIVSQQTALSLTLAVLALITVNNVGNRHRLDTILEMLRIRNGNDIVEEFPQNFTGDIEHARDIYLTGVHHSSTMSEYYAAFEQMVNSGGHLRVLIAQPEGAACAMTAMRFAGSVAPEQERARTRANIQTFVELANRSPELVEIRLLDYLFEYSAVLVDPFSGHGIVYVQRYTFKTMGGARKPKLTYRSSDGGWYNLYRSEIISLWEIAEPFCPDPNMHGS